VAERHGDRLGFIGLRGLDSNICGAPAQFEQGASGESISCCETGAEEFDRQIDDLWKTRVFAFDQHFQDCRMLQGSANDLGLRITDNSVGLGEQQQSAAAFDQNN